jgi:formimidoylglutamase
MSFEHLNDPGVEINSYIEDEYETRVNAAIRPWDQRSEVDAGLLGIPYDGASVVRRGSKEAPDEIRRQFVYNTTYSPDFDVDFDTLDVADLGDVDTLPMDLQRTRSRAISVIEEIHDRDIVPLIVGGDHSVSYSTVTAACARDDVDDLGLIQFDAHQDVRHSHSDQPSSGVQFRELLDERPELSGESYAQIGIRGFMNSRTYMDYAEQQDISVFSGKAVNDRGMDAVLTDALEVATSGTDAVFVSLDVDVLDISIAPGTAAPSPAGIGGWDMMKALFRLGATDDVLGMDLVEVSPPHDVQEITSITAATMLLHFLGGVASRE